MPFGFSSSPSFWWSLIFFLGFIIFSLGLVALFSLEEGKIKKK